MTVLLELSPEVEAKLTAKAAERGLAVPDYVKSMVEQTVKQEILIDHSAQQQKGNQEALTFLRQRMAEDKTDDPEELEERRIEWEEFKQAINESHTSDRVLFP